MRRAVFLDRDGVLNEVRMDGVVAASPRTVREFVLLPDAVREAGRLVDAGFELVVVTNQPDLASGMLATQDLDDMHAQLRRELPCLHFEVCPHVGPDNCVCRKPRPGLIMRSADRLGIDVAASWTIGDRWVDVAAGGAAGTRTVLLRRPWSFRPTSSGAPPADLAVDHTVARLREAVDLILGHRAAS